MTAPVDHHLRRRDVPQFERLAIGALALGELGPGEGVGPAQIVPVVDAIGQDDHARLGRHGLDRAVGVGTA